MISTLDGALAGMQYPREFVKAVNVFVAAAIAARNTWQAKNTARAAQEATVLARFVAADPQAGG
jgi:hypothetical protein